MIQILFVQAMLFLLLENVTHGAEWTPKEMNPDSLKPTVEKFITPDCDGSPCEHKIAYFTSKKISGKTILYINGGPGQIVDRVQPDLKDLEENFNVVYFDIRGAGLSAPQRAVDNSKDKFLRAKDIVKDIEAIKKQVLKNAPWDAIYGHSAGTVFAQLYAQEFGESGVKRLILSAPVSRHLDNEPYRAKMMVENLKNIYENNTVSVSECNWIRPESSLSEGLIQRMLRQLEKAFQELVALLIDRDKSKFYAATNNFCFLDTQRKEKILTHLKRKLDVIDKYGSISFVRENHELLAAQDDGRFKDEFPYPERFFAALYLLDMYGSPKRRESDISLIGRSQQVNAALVIGYYLELPPESQDAISESCNKKAPFFDRIGVDVADLLCDRFKEVDGGSNRSARSANVLGIHTGIHRWPARVMPGNPLQCKTGPQFIAFAKSSPGDNPTAKLMLRKVGFEARDNICPWDPANHKHRVPTLILKGSADSATNGCQAERWFKDGLSGTKVYVEFTELGHSWIQEINPSKKNDLKALLAKFVENPAADFASSLDIEIMRRLGAIVHATEGLATCTG